MVEIQKIILHPFKPEPQQMTNNQPTQPTQSTQPFEPTKETIKTEEHDGLYIIESVANDTNEPNETSPNFDSEMYEETPKAATQRTKSTDILPEHYDFDSSYMMSYKAAKLSGKVKSPYIVMKTMDKSSKVKEIDTIYRTDVKPKYNEYKRNVIVGFIEGGDSYRTVKFKQKQAAKYVGTVNEDFPIYKKKPLNSKLVGFIKLSESSPTEDYYLAVVKKVSILSFVPYIAIPLALLIIITQMNWGMIWDGLMKDVDNLKNLGSKVTEAMTIHDWNVYHEGYATVGSDGTVVLNIKTSDFLNTHYKVFLYIDDAEVFASEELDAGASLDSIKVPILNSLEAGDYTCKLVCKLYETIGIPILEVSNYVIITVPEK